MSRLAWFTPLPPARTGVAAYSAEVLPLLAREHEMDVFTDQPTPGAIDAHDFVWRNLRAPYDLAVYQLGNSPAHDFMWPYMTRFSGLVVLHDALLHHARAMALLGRRRAAEYCEELRFSHPDAPPGIANLVMANLAGSLFYHWPMIGVAVRSARLVAVHSARLRNDLAAEFSSTPFELIRMGVSDPGASTGTAGPDPAEVRARHSLPPDAVLFVAFGGITPETRIRQAIRPSRRSDRTGVEPAFCWSVSRYPSMTRCRTPERSASRAESACRATCGMKTSRRTWLPPTCACA
jgi:hypothetical protein